MANDNVIGERLNVWRPPVFTLGPSEGYLQRQIFEHPYLENMNISHDSFEEHCIAADEVLKHILRLIKRHAKENFEGLIIHDYVKQGSSREGLKVNDALEFDGVLIFEIENMIISRLSVASSTSGEDILGYIKVRVENGDELIDDFPWLSQRNILELKHGEDFGYFLNTKNLQDRVFKSIMDKTNNVINRYLDANNRSNYGIRGFSHPPTFDTRVSLDGEISELFTSYRDCIGEGLNMKPRKRQSLDFDIVPALLIRQDEVPDPYTVRSGFIEVMHCPVYAVIKWTHKMNCIDKCKAYDNDFLWRECTSGYEKHLLDIGRRNLSQRYIMTACRILKSYVLWHKNYQLTTNQLHCVTVSYYLKHLTFHCIALLTIPSNESKLSGVKEALGYMLCFLGLCIEYQNLPHFFYGNPWASVLFPNCSFLKGRRKKNLYTSINSHTFRKAQKDFDKMLKDLDGLYLETKDLDGDRIGRFKELLGLSHTYEKPVPEPEPSLYSLCAIL